jgi:hypothetical protein
MTRTTTCWILLLIACVPAFGAPKPPAWISGRDPAYPEAKYLLGVGLGKDLDGARANARAEIARVFQSRVEQVLTDVQTERSTSKNARRGASRGTQSSELKTTVSTDDFMEGVKIVHTWNDRKSKQVYALAILDKAAERRTLSGKILEQEEIVKIGRASCRERVS